MREGGIICLGVKVGIGVSVIVKVGVRVEDRVGIKVLVGVGEAVKAKLLTGMEVPDMPQLE